MLGNGTAPVTLQDKREKQRMGRSGQLTAQQHKAIELLIEGHTNKSTSIELGVAEETVVNWKRKKVFAREYVRAARQVTEAGMNLLKVNLTAAVERLILISESETPNRVQLEANKHIIKMVMEDEVLKQLNERIEKLEAGANREP